MSTDSDIALAAAQAAAGSSTTASEAASAAALALAQTRVISEIDTADDAVALLVRPGPEGSQTKAAVAAEVAEQVAAASAPLVTAAYHGADSNFARPSTPGVVLWVGTVTPSNSIAGDLEFIADPVAVEPTVDWLGAWDAHTLGLATLAPVASWPSADAAHTFSQATAARQPTFYAEDTSNPAYVRFDGVDDWLTGVNWGEVKRGVTYIMAFRIHTMPALGPDFHRMFDSIDTTNRLTFYYSRPDDADDNVGLHLSGNSVRTIELPTGVTDWHILTWQHTGDANAVARLDGQNVGLAGGTGVHGTAGMMLGSNQLGSSQHAAFDVHAIRVHATGTVGSVLSLGDVVAVETALADRLGIALGA